MKDLQSRSFFTRVQRSSTRYFGGRPDEVPTVSLPFCASSKSFDLYYVCTRARMSHVLVRRIEIARVFTPCCFALRSQLRELARYNFLASSVFVFTRASWQRDSCAIEIAIDRHGYQSGTGLSLDRVERVVTVSVSRWYRYLLSLIHIRIIVETIKSRTCGLRYARQTRCVHVFRV